MSEEEWIRCFERAEEELPEGTRTEAVAARADELAADREARLADDAWERFKDSPLGVRS